MLVEMYSFASLQSVAQICGGELKGDEAFLWRLMASACPGVTEKANRQLTDFVWGQEDRLIVFETYPRPFVINAVTMDDHRCGVGGRAGLKTFIIIGYI